MKKIDQLYEVIKELGQGLSGEVFLVEREGKQVALKLLKTSIAQMKPEEAEAHFKAEFSLLKQLSHPHIATILDFGKDGSTGRNYFTTGYIEGGDLFKETRETELKNLEKYFIQALRALEYLHGRGITHYDLKPDNILLNREKDSIRIIDFGLAGFRPRGQLAGTPSYMAPEVILGNQPDSRADLYSLGVTFYECATGDNPFRAGNLAETLRRQEKLMPPPAHEENPAASQAFSEVLGLLLNKNPADRPGTAGAALRFFSQLSGEKIDLETSDTTLSYLPNETKLIGRQQEMQKFRQALENLGSDAAQGYHQMILVQGLEGVGKTRLLKEFRYEAQMAGIRTQDIHQGEIPETNEATCIFMDPATSEDLKNLYMGLTTSSNPLLLVVTSREETPAWEDTLLLSINNFTPEEIQEYLAALTGIPSPPGGLVKELFRRTQGSPLYLTELMKELIRQGNLLDQHGRWTKETFEDLGVDFDGTHASEQLLKILKEDFQKLDQPAQIILRWISVHPQPIPAGQLEQASHQEDLSYWLLDLLSSGFLEREENSQTYRLSNPFLQDYILGSIPESDRELMHQTWAKVFAEESQEGFSHLFHTGRSGKSPEARDALFELARHLERKGKFEAALENLLLGETIPSRDLADYTRFKIKIGEDLIILNRSQKALEHFSKIEEELGQYADDATGLPAKISIFEKIGTTYLRLNKLDKAEEVFNKGLEKLSEGPKNAVKDLIFQNYLGRIQLQRGKLDQAATTFESTRKEWQKKLSKEDQNLVQNNDYGMVLLTQGKHEAAKKIFEEDLEFFRRIPDEHLEARTLYNLAQTESALKNMDETVKLYKQCIKLCQKQKNQEILLRAYNGLGVTYHTRHEFTEAHKYYSRAFNIAQKTGDFFSQANLETNLGIVLNASNQSAQAMPHLKAAIHLLEKLGLRAIQEKYIMATAMLELGDVYRIQGNFSEANHWLHESRDLVHKNEQLASFHFPIQTTQAKLFFDEGKGEQAQKIHQELQNEDLSDSERTELAKLKNYLQQTERKTPRKPEVTQSYSGRPQKEISTLFYNQLRESDYLKLLELTRFINAETDIDYVLKNVLQHALELSQAERGLILLLDDHDQLQVSASINTTPTQNLNEISTRVAEEALKTGDIIETDDAANDERFNEYQSVMILKLRSILCIPIHSRNKTVGVLYLDNRYRPGAFEPARLPLLQAFCDQAGIAIENAKLFEKYEKTQKKLQKSLTQVTEEAEHYHELLGEKTGDFLPTKYAYDNIIARSKLMYEVFQLLDKITGTNISVFINGETGTGKELIAKALHYNNPLRSAGRFVAINCGGIPANLIESELFGYKAGAFTGASKDKKGLFLEADGGTLFMDEVADLDLSMQVKLLRALEEGEAIPVGDTRPVHFDIRVVCASHRNLEDMVAKEEFREDLFYRLCQIRIPLPPLRDRKEDISLLADLFIKNFAKENKLAKVPQITGALLKKFIDHDWPGNIRELENTVRVVCALSEGKDLSPKHLPANFGTRKIAGAALSPGTETAPEAATASNGGNGPIRVPIDNFNFYEAGKTWIDYERLIFAKTFAAAEFKPIEAAKSLGVSTATFYKRIKDFQLNDQNNSVYQENFTVPQGKILRTFLEEVFLAAYKCAGEKSYQAIKWLGISQGHFYNVLKSARKQ